MQCEISVFLQILSFCPFSRKGYSSLVVLHVKKKERRPRVEADGVGGSNPSCFFPFAPRGLCYLVQGLGRVEK